MTFIELEKQIEREQNAAQRFIPAVTLQKHNKLNALKLKHAELRIEFKLRKEVSENRLRQQIKRLGHGSDLASKVDKAHQIELHAQLDNQNRTLHRIKLNNAFNAIRMDELHKVYQKRAMRKRPLEFTLPKIPNRGKFRVEFVSQDVLSEIAIQQSQMKKIAAPVVV